jgi:hypothetical protein
MNHGIQLIMTLGVMLSTCAFAAPQPAKKLPQDTAISQVAMDATLSSSDLSMHAMGAFALGKISRSDICSRIITTGAQVYSLSNAFTKGKDVQMLSAKDQKDLLAKVNQANDIALKFLNGPCQQDSSTKQQILDQDTDADQLFSLLKDIVDYFD